MLLDMMILCLKLIVDGKAQIMRESLSMHLVLSPQSFILPKQSNPLNPFNQSESNTMKKDTFYDILTSVIIGLLLAMFALAYFDVLVK